MKLFGSSSRESSAFSAALNPEVAFYAVGDIHGCDTLLERLIERMVKDSHPTARLVCVGDYIDRGEDSAGVLRRLHEMQTGSGGMMTCLMGNHERMLLDYLDNPAKAGLRWQRNGGLQTLASYRLPAVPDGADPKVWEQSRDMLRDAIGPDIEHWLRNLPLQWQTGNVLVTHAGADPRQPVDAQTEQALLWGRSPFFEQTRTDGIWVAHGHVITREPKAEHGRIPLDTGAYATGKLTAVLVEPESATYLSA